MILKREFRLRELLMINGFKRMLLLIISVLEHSPISLHSIQDLNLSRLFLPLLSRKWYLNKIKKSSKKHLDHQTEMVMVPFLKKSWQKVLKLSYFLFITIPNYVLQLLKQDIQQFQVIKIKQLYKQKGFQMKLT